MKSVSSLSPLHHVQAVRDYINAATRHSNGDFFVLGPWLCGEGIMAPHDATLLLEAGLVEDAIRRQDAELKWLNYWSVGDSGELIPRVGSMRSGHPVVVLGEVMESELRAWRARLIPRPGVASRQAYRTLVGTPWSQRDRSSSAT